MATQPQMLFSLGERALVLRRRADLTLEQLSEKTGLSWTYLGKIERGETQNPGAGVLVKLSKALDTTTDFLLGLTDDPRSYTLREAKKPSKRSRQRSAARSPRPIQRPLAAAVR